MFNISSGGPNASTSQNTRKIVWAIVAVLVLVVIIVVAVILNSPASKYKPSNSNNNYSTQTGAQGNYNSVTNATTYDAPKGQIVDGFPAGLADTSNGIVQSSYHTSSGGYDQYTVNLTSKLSSSVSLNNYVTILSKSPYAITSTHEFNPKTNTASIYATSGKNIISIVFSSDPQIAQTNDIAITYVVPVLNNKSK